MWHDILFLQPIFSLERRQKPGHTLVPEHSDGFHDTLSVAPWLKVIHLGRNNIAHTC